MGPVSGQTLMILPPRAPSPAGGLTPLVANDATAAGIPGRRAHAYGADCSLCSVSGRMSIRQPVSRAASRAFCPSLPIASDSW